MELMVMEQPHLSAELDYLTQKLQEANASIAVLQQRVEGQEYVIQEQNLRIQQLETDLSQTGVQLQRTAHVEDQLRQLKNEMLEYIDRRTRRAATPAIEANANLILKQLETHTNLISELRREVEKTGRYDDQISLARTETNRLNQNVNIFQAQLDALRKEIAERTNPIKFIEQQRQGDVRKVAEVEAELPELHKKLQEISTKVQLISQQIPQYAKYDAALETLRDEIRRYREHMDFQLAQRERQIKDWTGVADATMRRIQEIESAMEKYTEFYQLNKRSLSSLQEFQERIQRDQHRFGELQRLAEERQRTETEKFRADFEQRWQNQSMELQPQFEDFQRVIETLRQRIGELAKLQSTMDNQIHLLLEIIEEDVQTRALAAKEWQQRFEEIAEGQA
jgi:chromosome segregation ATPase